LSGGGGVPKLAVSTAHAVELPVFSDERGSLSFAEAGGQLPFVPARYFVIFGVPRGATRGNHAHREQQQFLVCLRGSCSLELDDGDRRDTIRLDSPRLGLHLREGTWCILSDFTGDALVMVLVSGPYSPEEYINDYPEFRRWALSR
jgi:dTDP-4-dehydrorhamnose 3,5-epimerase-like enzyme